MPVFSICANAGSNIFTNISPIQSNTDQIKPKYRSIHAPIQTNTHNIAFNTCTSTCQYRHQYCQIRHPSQLHPCSLHSQLPWLTVSHGFLCLPSSTLQQQQSQPHPLVCCQTVSALWQPNFPHNSKIIQCLFCRMKLHYIVNKSILAPGACSTQIPHEVWLASKNGNCQLPSLLSVWLPESLSSAMHLLLHTNTYQLGNTYFKAWYIPQYLLQYYV